MEIVHYDNEDLIDLEPSSTFFFVPRTHYGFDDDDDDENNDLTAAAAAADTDDSLKRLENAAVAARDTSHTSRIFELDNTRDSVSRSFCENTTINNSNDDKSFHTVRQDISAVCNTLDSILDLDESQCGEGDEDVFPIFSDSNEDDRMIYETGDQDLPSNSLLADDDNTRSYVKNDSDNHHQKLRSVSPTPSSSPVTDRSNRNISIDCSKGEESNRNGSDHPETKSTTREPKGSSIMDGLTLYSVTNSFVDSLCTSTACAVSDNYRQCSNSKYQKSSSFDGGSSALCSGSGNDDGSASCTAVVSMNVFDLLGCNKPPGQSELEEIWTLPTATDILRGKYRQQQSILSIQNEENPGPVRASIRRRLKRIHRLRMDDRRITGASRHGVTITDRSYDYDHSYRSLNNIREEVHTIKQPRDQNIAIGCDEGDHVIRKSGRHNYQLQNQKRTEYRAIDKSNSMIDDPLSIYFGHDKIEPIPIENEEDGYDSDPEVNHCSMPSSMVVSSESESSVSTDQAQATPSPSSSCQFLDQQNDVTRPHPIPTDEFEMKFLVQQTLNLTWTLTWHPNSKNRRKYKLPHNKPICVNIWLERGTVITNSGVVVEPAFMWRDAYQPLLLSQHKLNSSTQKPWSMRLLNACRVTHFLSAATPDVSKEPFTIDRTEYPIARQNSSFLLKSCDGEEFLLEAKCPNEVIAITERWKLVIARFASLAVTEDVTGIAKEFFHPTSESRMLTISDDDV